MTFCAPLLGVWLGLCPMWLIQGCEERHQERLAALPLQGLWSAVQREEGPLFAGMKYRPQEVVLALRLRFKYRLSSLEVSQLMTELGHPISKNTVLFWTDRFADSFQMLQRRYRLEYSKIWHIDEFHVRLRGGKAYIYVVEGDWRDIIALELTKRRDREATARVRRKAQAPACHSGCPYGADDCTHNGQAGGRSGSPRGLR